LRPFKLKNILDTLDTVHPKKYMRLAINLGVKTQDVEKSEVDHGRNSERVLIDIINLWISSVTDPKPSWHSLKEALSTL
jgi:hypothetical protein